MRQNKGLLGHFFRISHQSFGAPNHNFAVKNSIIFAFRFKIIFLHNVGKSMTNGIKIYEKIQFPPPSPHTTFEDNINGKI